jgi:hypothetical protein
MGTLASDIDNPQFAGAVPDTTGLGIKFFKEARYNEFKSKAEGRPIYEDAIMYQIVLPGQGLFDVKGYVTEKVKARFPIQWANWERTHSNEAMAIGTPLEQWPMLSLSQVEELKAMKFSTVENIAEASDATLQRLGMAGGMAGTALRERAKRFLEVARGDAIANKNAEELEKLRRETAEKDAKHAAELKAMQEQMQSLMATVQSVAAPKKRGRPKKSEDQPEA